MPPHPAPTRRPAPVPRTLAAGLLVVSILGAGRVAQARMDIANDGPLLDAGRFAMRITNIGVIGNAFFNRGLSYDPSFEFPKGSGQECLNHAELWVSATRDDGTTGVSGGPVFEFRPTIADDDVVLRRYAGERGTRATFDDDGDGRVDEEFLDGADDDGDGEVDEDLRFPAQETAACRYTDDQPEAVEFVYESGERHIPLNITVRQEAHAWAVPGYDKIAGLQWTITNHGSRPLHDVRLGVFADLDARDRRGGGGHIDDFVTPMRDSVTIPTGRSTLNTIWNKECFTTLQGDWWAVRDASAASDGPWSAVVGLSHTTDPLGFLVNTAFQGVEAAAAAARAPRRDTTFRYSVYSSSLPPGQGGPPIVDAERLAAMEGRYAEAPRNSARDYSVLVTCGPFRILEPGQSVQFAVALVAGENADSLMAAVQSARLAWRGTALNLQPDQPNTNSYLEGRTGINGHEICYEPPPGVTFTYDPNCTPKFTQDPAYRPLPGLNPETVLETRYAYGSGCVWTDFDCDACTGNGGAETTANWYVHAPAPPQPLHRATPGDRQVAVEWDNLPEVLADASVIPGAPWRFWGYRVYRLDDWQRESLLPPTRRWQQLASFAVDTTLGARPLTSIMNTTMEHDSIAYERKHYPVGRYRYVDTRALDGFDYHYVVTAVAQRTVTVSGTSRIELLESPFRASFVDVVRPRTEAGATYRDGRVWVVPNPFRASAPWERTPVPGDVFTRHIDFLGLPRARSTIRIYTLAGDLVRSLEHDGTTGNGQAAWDLISRNGQDVESGIYLFTVDSSAGHQVGRFVVIR